MDAVDWQLALGRAPGLTAQLLRTTLARLDAAHGAGCALAELLGRRSGALPTLGWPAATCAALQALDSRRIANDRRWVEREQIVLVDAAAQRYPPLLAQIPAAPPLLYVKGDATLLASPQLAMVGSRHPTQPGRRTAYEFAAHLASAGVTVSSGLALGIDAASHEGALHVAGRTLAVLGTSLDTVYPPQHRALAARIASQGALISQFPPGTPPLKANFPRRNRILSGLCAGTLVVEAAQCSGALITARLAARIGRQVFAIPGSIHNPLSRGCHALIREGAKIIESPQELLDELGFHLPKQSVMFELRSAGGSGTRAATLDKGCEILLDALGYAPASLDSLVVQTGLPSQSVASMLLILELEGAVGVHAGGRYMRLQAPAADSATRARSELLTAAVRPLMSDDG
jgi:DNA processing protein